MCPTIKQTFIICMALFKTTRETSLSLENRRGTTRGRVKFLYLYIYTHTRTCLESSVSSLIAVDLRNDIITVDEELTYIYIRFYE